MAQEINNIAALVQVVNGLLEGGEPQNISIDTFSGFTGYKPQFIIDAMNEGVGFGNWGFEEVSNEIAEGEKGAVIVSQVRVFLKDCAFQPTGWGQARITKGDVGDAKKGAQTDAIKKALSYFSIGNRAYLGLLNEESQGNQNGNKRQVLGQRQNTPRSLPQGKSDPLQAALEKHRDRAHFLGVISSDEQWWPWLKAQGVTEVRNGTDLKKVNDALVAVEHQKKAS